MRLSEIQGADPMIVLLSRGHYCPKERRHLARLVDFYPDLVVGYAKIVTISTDGMLETNELRTGLGAQWPFLSDPDRRVQRVLDIQEYTDPKHDPMVPHTIVLEPELHVFKIYEGHWYWGRPSIDELWRDLRDITSRVRPDWSFARPDLKDAWTRGDRDRFFPYGKRLEEVLSR
jgi:peroxiredoxin